MKRLWNSSKSNYTITDQEIQYNFEADIEVNLRTCHKLIGDETSQISHKQGQKKKDMVSAGKSVCPVIPPL